MKLTDDENGISHNSILTLATKYCQYDTDKTGWL